MDTYANDAIEWATITGFFTFTTSGPPTCRSTPNNIEVFTDAGLTQELTDNSQVELVSDVTNEWRLKVYNNVPFPDVLTVYIKEITLGFIYASKKVNIKVCGTERLYVYPRKYSIAFDKVSTYAGANIPWSTLNSFLNF